MAKLTKAQRSAAARKGWRTRRANEEARRAQRHSRRRAIYRAKR